MCIAFISTAHPSYAYIILGNRDEFLNRPTQPLSRWPPPDSHILAGRDLQHPARGTWLGITDHGRLAILTNFREHPEPVHGPNDPSRGEIAKSFLELPPAQADAEGLEGFAKRFLEEEGSKWKNVGGFSLIFGDVRPSVKQDGQRTLGILSNRTPDVDGVIWVGDDDGVGMAAGGKTVGQTCALSNSAYGDDTWPKVSDGERLLRDLIEENVRKGEDEAVLLQNLFALLSRDTLTHWKPGESFTEFALTLRKSIFVPPSGLDEQGRPKYGTQKQSVILVRNDGNTTIIEKTLFDNDARPVEEERRFDFSLKDNQKI